MMQIRTATFQNQSNEDMTLSGTAIVFNQPTISYRAGNIDYKETIAHTALNNVDLSNILLKYNHSNQMPLARCSNGSLILNVDNYGLHFRAKLIETSFAKDIFILVKSGGLSQMSFGFTVSKDAYDSKTHTRTIKQIDKLFEISIVDVPAYSTTSVEARSLFQEELKNEVDLLKTQLIIKTYM